MYLLRFVKSYTIYPLPIDVGLEKIPTQKECFFPRFLRVSATRVKTQTRHCGRGRVYGIMQLWQGKTPGHQQKTTKQESKNEKTQL